MFICLIFPIKFRDEFGGLIKLVLFVLGLMGLFIYSLISDMARQLSQQPVYLEFVDALKHSHSVQKQYLMFMLLPGVVLDLLVIIYTIVTKESSMGNPVVKPIICAAVAAAGSLAIMGSYGVMDTGQVNLIPKILFTVMPALIAAMAAIDLRMVAYGLALLILKIVKR